MKIKFDAIEEELSLSQAKELYKELQELFEPKAYVPVTDYSPFFPHHITPIYGSGNEVL